MSKKSRIKGTLLSFSLITSILSLSVLPHTSFAEINSEKDSRYVAYDGTEYVYTTKVENKKAGWTHVATNNSTSADSVNYSVSRTQSTTYTGATSAEFGLMQNKVAASAEISSQTSKTFTTTMNFSIPAKSTYKLEYGSMVMSTSGKINVYSKGLLSSSKTVSGTWSHGSYSTKTPMWLVWKISNYFVVFL